MSRAEQKHDNTYTQYSAFANKNEYLELLEAAVSGSEIGYLICDADCNVIKLNQAQIDITQQDASYNLGRNMRVIEVEDGAPSATVMVQESRKPVKIEQHLSNGQSYLVYAFPCFDKTGALKYIVSNLLDITEIYDTQKSLEKNCQKLSIQLQELQKQIDEHAKIIYQSKIMRRMIMLCDKVAEFDSNVLLQGESGVGKEKIAEYIYEKSRRNKKPYVKLNCAAIPEQLLESELFGYEGGAFTGADKSGKKGLLDCTDQGTLLLDEISELSLPLQAKLLRFLQEGEFYRVGGRTPVRSDVRVIAASNRDLWNMVQENRFREDLYYRLNVIPIRIPPLRERKEDIPLLVGYFTKRFNEKHGIMKSWSVQAVNRMVKADYPGNIRELQNVIERILVLVEGDVIEERDVNAILYGLQVEATTPKEGISLKELMSEYEKEILQNYFNRYHTEAAVAKALESSQSTISRKRIQYNIVIPNNE